MTAPPTQVAIVAIQAHVRRMILKHEPRLSTGAYGDEGQILLELEQVAVEALTRGHESSPLAAAWLTNEVAGLESVAIQAWALMAESLLARWRPLRFALGGDFRQGLKLLVYRSLVRLEAGEPQAYLWIYERVAELVDGQEVLDLGRGDALWQVLHRADLLAPLAPFLREQEVRVPVPAEVLG